MIRRPPRSTLDRSSAASDVYKRQGGVVRPGQVGARGDGAQRGGPVRPVQRGAADLGLSLIHISEPTRPY